MLEPNERMRLGRLLTSLAEAFAGEGRRGGDLAAEALRNARTRPYRRTRSTARPGPLLETVCALPNAIPLAQLVYACCNVIDWTHWEGTGLATNVSANLYSTELVGPDGHFEADTVRVGLLVSDAQTDYPISSHAGEETYVILAGEAEWFIDGGAYVARLPGALVHHPAWVPHGRRTGIEPFLGVWRWSGDLDLSTFNVADPS